MENKTDFGGLIELRKQTIDKWIKAGLLDQSYTSNANLTTMLAPNDNQVIDKPYVLPLVRRILNQLEGYDIVACFSNNPPYEVDENRIMF